MLLVQSDLGIQRWRSVEKHVACLHARPWTAHSVVWCDQRRLSEGCLRTALTLYSHNPDAGPLRGPRQPSQHRGPQRQGRSRVRWAAGQRILQLLEYGGEWGKSLARGCLVPGKDPLAVTASFLSSTNQPHTCTSVLSGVRGTCSAGGVSFRCVSPTRDTGRDVLVRVMLQGRGVVQEISLELRACACVQGVAVV